MRDESKLMEVHVWSDVRCPFCYIGKRKFEHALAKFPHRDEVKVIWHSFQLDPGLTTDPKINAYDYLAKAKRITREQTIEMHKRVEGIGRAVGIEFRFDKLVVANSFNAHRLIQMSKALGLADEAEEALFRAHFIEGMNIDDEHTLENIGSSGIGIDKTAVAEMLASGEYAAEVRDDENAARSLGIRGVPFFIFNDALAVSGAQDPDLFLQALSRAHADYKTGTKVS